MCNENNTPQKDLQVSAADYNLLQDIRANNLHVVSQEQFNFINKLEECDLELSFVTLEAMANLEFHEPGQVANLISYIAATAFSELEADDFGFSVNMIPRLLKLQDFLYSWQVDYAVRECLRLQQQEADALAEEE